MVSMKISIFMVLAVTLLASCDEGVGRPGSPAWQMTASDEAKQEHRRQERAAYVPISQNTNVTPESARRICQARAENAADIALRNYRPSNTEYSANCREGAFGTVNCTSESYISGGAWGGVAAAFEENSLKRRIVKSEFEGCMIQMGFYKE